jgi:hypothetical protein
MTVYTETGAVRPGRVVAHPATAHFPIPSHAYGCRNCVAWIGPEGFQKMGACQKSAEIRGGRAAPVRNIPTGTKACRYFKLNPERKDR